MTSITYQNMSGWRTKLWVCKGATINILGLGLARGLKQSRSSDEWIAHQIVIVDILKPCSRVKEVNSLLRLMWSIQMCNDQYYLPEYEWMAHQTVSVQGSNN